MRHLLEKSILSLIPMNIVATKSSPVLLYHSLGKTSDFDKNIDHVNLDLLELQLREIQKYWKFVSIDEYSEAKSTKGLASVTIDDGYKNVMEEALPVFESLDIPFSIFINSSTFQGKVFWRDKIRYLIENRLVPKFIKSSHIFTPEHKDDFYRATKNRHFNSKLVETELDRFFQTNNINMPTDLNLCFDDSKYLIKHPLLSYGNHTANHYVLSSLNEEEQHIEIKSCKDFLDQYSVNTSSVFSVPFGGRDTINQTTTKILESLGYTKTLLSENKINNLQTNLYIERFMPKQLKITASIKKLFLKNSLQHSKSAL